MKLNSFLSLIFIVNFILIYSQTAKLSGKFRNGSIKSVYYTYTDNLGNLVKDSAILDNNTFNISLNITEPTRVLIVDNKEFQLKNNENNVTVFIYPQTTNLSLNAQNFKDFEANPAEINNLSKLYNQQYLANVDSKLKDLLKRFQTTKTESEKSEILKEFENIQNLNFLNKLNFASQNPSYLTLFLLEDLLREKEASNFILELENLYNDQNTNWATALSSNIKNRLKILKMNKLGSSVIDLELKDIDGKTFKLSEIYRKKLLLLDYWASWCVPCRNELPELKNLKKKYENYFEIISISIDENPKKWLKAVQDDQMKDWVNILAKDQVNKDITSKYNISTSIPVKILISKEGKIIGRWNGGETLLETDRMIKEYLNY